MVVRPAEVPSLRAFVAAGTTAAEAGDGEAVGDFAADTAVGEVEAVETETVPEPPQAVEMSTALEAARRRRARRRNIGRSVEARPRVVSKRWPQKVQREEGRPVVRHEALLRTGHLEQRGGELCDGGDFDIGQLAD